MALVGLTVTLAPTVGPTVGGYLTELFSWHWLFLVNVIPGIARRGIAWLLVDFDEPDSCAAEATSTSSGSPRMAVFLGSLEYVLEEGPEERLVRTTAPILAASRRRRCRRGRLLRAGADGAGRRSSTSGRSSTATSRSARC